MVELMCEIGNESSEEDSTWDPTDAPKSDPSSIDNKEEGSYSPQKLDSWKVECWKSNEDLETVQRFADAVDINHGYEDVEKSTICASTCNEESGWELLGSPLQTFEANTAQKIFAPLTGLIATSVHSYDGSLQHECGQNSPTGQTVNNVQTNSGARIAATALFTANPHHKSLEFTTQCSPYNTLKCHSEEFNLGSPGSNVRNNAILRERSGEVLCSSFHSYMSSPSELNGYATIDTRNQTSRTFETDSLDDGAAFCEKNALDTQIYDQMQLPLDHESGRGSEIGCVHEDVQTGHALKSRDFCTASVHAGNIVDGYNRDLKQVKEKSPLLDTNPSNKQRIPSSSSKDCLKGSMPVPLAENGQHQNCPFKELKPKNHACSTYEDWQPQSPSGEREISLHPTSDSMPQDSQTIQATKGAADGGPVDKQVRGLSGLIELSGMETFTKLGLGPIGDMSVRAQFTTKIQHAFEGLGSNSSQENDLKKFRSSERKMGCCFYPIVEKRKDSHSASGCENDRYAQTEEGNRFRVDIEGSGITGGLSADNSKNRMESHFFTQRDPSYTDSAAPEDPDLYLQKVIAALSPSSHYDQTSGTYILDSQFSHPSYTGSATPENPDLYLPHVIAALNSVLNHVKKPALPSPTGITQEAMNDGDFPAHHVSVSSKSSERHADGSLCASTGKTLECPARRGIVHEHKILQSNSIVNAENLQVEKQSQSFVRTISLKAEKQPQNFDNKIDEFASIGSHRNQVSVEASSNEQPGFLVEINAPAGSFVEVELGGSPTMRVSHQEKRCRDADALHRNSNSFLLHHRDPRCNSQSTQRKSFDQRRHDHPRVQLNHRRCNPRQQANPLTSTHGEEYPCHAPHKLAPLNDFQGEDLRNMLQASRRPCNLSPKRDLHSKLSLVKIQKSVRFNIDEDDASHSWKSASVLKEDYCPNERTRGWDKTDDGQRAPRQHQRQLEVMRNPRPSILKSSKPQDCYNYEVQPTQTAKKLEDFATAAACLACELKGFMTHCCPELHMESRDERRLSGKPTLSTRFLRTPHNSSTDKHTHEVPAAIGEMKKAKDQQKMLSAKKCLSPKRPHPCQHLSGNDLNGDEERTSTIRKVGKHAIPVQEVSCKSEEERCSGRTGKKVDDWTGEVLNYDEFCQGLRELHAQRKKLEWLGNLLLSSGTATLQKSHAVVLSSKEEKEDVCGRNLKKILKSDVVSSSAVAGNKRNRSKIDPQESDGKFIWSDFGAVSNALREPVNKYVDVSGRAANGLRGPRLLKSCQLAMKPPLDHENSHVDIISDCLLHTGENCSSRKPLHTNILKAETVCPKIKAHNRTQEGISTFLKRMMRAKKSAMGRVGKPDNTESGENKDMWKSSLLHHNKKKLRLSFAVHRKKSTQKSSFVSRLANSTNCDSVIQQDTHAAGSGTELLPQYVHKHDNFQEKVVHGRLELHMCPHRDVCSPLTDKVASESPGLRCERVTSEETKSAKPGNVNLSRIGQNGHDYLKKNVLQTFDSSTSSLQVREDCPETSGAADLGQPCSKTCLSTHLVTPMTEVFQHKRSPTLKSNVDSAGPKTLTDMPCDDVISELQVRQQLLSSRSASTSAITSLEAKTNDKKSRRERNKLEVAEERTFRKSKEVPSKTVESFEGEESWSGSLKSIMEAYKAAQSTAVLMVSSSLVTRDEVEKIQDVAKKKRNMEKLQKKHSKKHERAGVREQKVREACKTSVQDQQKLVLNTEYLGMKDRMQGRFRKRDLQNNELRLRKLIYRTGQLRVKNKPDWNDSTVLSQEKHGTDQHMHPKVVTGALITNLLKDEVTTRRKAYKIKKLQPLKALETGSKSRRKTPVDLEMYANALSEMTMKAKPTLTKMICPREDIMEVDTAQRPLDEVTAEQFGTPLSVSKKRKDIAKYFEVQGIEHETRTNRLTESAVDCKNITKYPLQCSSEYWHNFMNKDTRESIDYWLNTSGGFEYLDNYNKVGEDPLFDIRASTSSIERKTNCSMRAVAESGLSDEVSLTSETVVMGSRGVFETGKKVSNVFENGPQNDHLDSPCIADRRSPPLSSEELSHEGGMANWSDRAVGVIRRPFHRANKSPEGSSLDTSYFSDQLVSMKLGHVDSIDNKVQGKGSSMEEGHRYPSSGRNTVSTAVGFSNLSSAHEHHEELSYEQRMRTGSVDQNPSIFTEHDKDPALLPSNANETLTEQEELELALLEIVLHSLLKDDLVNVTGTAEELPPGKSLSLENGLPADAAQSFHEPQAEATTTLGASILSAQLGTGQEATQLTKERRTHEGMCTGEYVPVVSDLGTFGSAKDHCSGSSKSSGGDWPEYKCIAEIESETGSSEEDEHWPEYRGVHEEETTVHLDHNERIEEVPSEHTSSIELEAELNLQSGSLLPQTAPVSTRPPYSAVHSLRAAERQPIDFPGIASLAFGYPSPSTTPTLKPMCQTMAEKSSVSVQTADFSMIKCPPPLGSSAVFVMPFYCLPDGRPILPPHSMYSLPFVASGGPSQTVHMPMATPEQGAQTASHVTFQSRGDNPTYPLPSTLLPGQSSQGPSETSTMPIPPQYNLQTPAPSPVVTVPVEATSHIRPPSMQHPVSEGGRQSTKASSKPVPLQRKSTSSYSKLGVVGLDELPRVCRDSRDSLSLSSDSLCSSPRTPSTYISSPEHESRVAAVLAHSSIGIQETDGHVLQCVSSDSGEEAEREVAHQERLNLDNQRLSLLQPDLSQTGGRQLRVQAVATDNTFNQSKIEGTVASSSRYTHEAMPSDINQMHQSRALEGVDFSRSTVVVPSYDGSDLSEDYVKHMRHKTCQTFSDQSCWEELDRSYQIDSRSAAQAAMTQTSSWSSGEIRGTFGLTGRQIYGNLNRYFTSQTPVLSEGEVEPGELPSEGECGHLYNKGWASHRSLHLGKRTDYQPGVYERGGETGGMATCQIVDSRAQIDSSSQSLSEGELRPGVLPEPGEVRATREAMET